MARRGRSHGNDELIAPAADSSLNTRSRTLLDCLHRPTASELVRKRKVDKNPPKGKKKSRGSCTCVSNPKTITPQQRVNQYKNEFFSVSNKKLFCQACRDELSVKSSIIAAHIKSAKHSNGKVRLMSQKSREKEIAERVFSILKNSFGDQQLSALEDYLEASLILQYNK